VAIEPKKPFSLTTKQLEANRIVAGAATHVMLYGGSRSGKTFLHVRNMVLRALKAPNSHHVILRFRFNHLKASIIYGTLPKVMRLCFPDIKYVLNKTDWFLTLPNGSEIWFGGLDDKERTEKILGQEYSTMLFNEASQIPIGSRETAITRLAELADTMESDKDGNPVITGVLKPRAFYDCNPTNKAHWTYLMFIKGVDPTTKNPLPNAADFVYFKMNPQDNAENLTANYLETLGALSLRMRKRFRDGDFADATPNQLFSDETIDRWRVLDPTELPDFQRVVVAVDPSGTSDVTDVDGDAIGIVVVALGVDGHAYIIEDDTCKGPPGVWGKIAVNAYERHEADLVVAEVNYGGGMVKYVIQTQRPNVRYKAVTATRGKVIRAEPFSALYDGGKIHHIGIFPELEDEMVSFSTAGYTGPRSPNRADALFWALTEIFPGVIKAKKEETEFERPTFSGQAWMG